MGSIVIFGAGGRAGRRAVAEAIDRGHRVTAVVRDPGRHADLADLAGVGGHGVTVVAGDVTDPRSVAEAAAGHDAAIAAVHRADVPPEELYVAAAEALLDGLPKAGVGRLVVVGIGTILRTPSGGLVHDQPGFPKDGRALSLGHLAGLEVLRRRAGEGGADGQGGEGGDAAVDWVVLAPPPVVLDAEADRTGVYRTGTDTLLAPAEPVGAAGETGRDAAFSYADLAVALVDEAEAPRHHRALVAVG